MSQRLPLCPPSNGATNVTASGAYVHRGMPVRAGGFGARCVVVTPGTCIAGPAAVNAVHVDARPVVRD